ncbi:PDZ domain containing 3b [Thalassophryne amazonica]|uniref:PDZ domain containing 3b n=1 Tax=Thalassophryne amazonica TaxID=390379 RepID=UPI0014719B25|nr:PDZ domain containing 3b [Thalassophryne amazonica]
MTENTALVDTRKTTTKITFKTKEGIDNQGMVLIGDTDGEFTPSPRLCVLKREEGESYGFHLRIERDCRGHVIRNVAAGGIAQCSGLQNGDRLLEVNGCFVDNILHLEVTRKIKLSGQQVGLLVLDGEQYEQAVSRGHDLRDISRMHKVVDCRPPRLCHISKQPASGLGINFTPVEGRKGQFSVSPVAGGAAEKAGVRKGDRLVWMNGASVSELTPSALSMMMKKCGNHITIMVIDSESEKNYVEQGMPILPAMAVPHNLPYKARKLHLVCGPEGYGFLLRLEAAPAGRTAHVVRKVDRGGPAGKAGMKDGEVLLEVNEESVESLTHEEIVDKVKQSTQQISFTTIRPQGLEFYTQLGLSPLLFCEDAELQQEKDSGVAASSVPEQTGHTLTNAAAHVGDCEDEGNHEISYL